MSSEGLHIRTWGSTGPSVLLLHGSTSSASTWWQVGPDLARRGWTVVAPDLPSHGSSPPAQTPLVPAVAAAAVASTLEGRRFDVIVGHSFGAAVAVALLADDQRLATRAILEELPGPASVAWDVEAAAVREGAQDAGRDERAAYAQTRSLQPRWAEQDCRQAVADLATCHVDDIAAGLAMGSTWQPRISATTIVVPVLLLLAPDAAGVNRLEDATALRDADRAQAIAALRARVRIVDAGHCIHRDDPGAWLDAVTTAAASADSSEAPRHAHEA